MMDVVGKTGDRINTKRLSEELGFPWWKFRPQRNRRRRGGRTGRGPCQGAAPTAPHVFSGSVEHALAHIEEATEGALPERSQRWFIVKLFERDEKVLAHLKLSDALRAHIEKDIQSCETEMDDDAESIITNERYLFIGSVVRGCLHTEKKRYTLLFRQDRQSHHKQVPGVADLRRGHVRRVLHLSVYGRRMADRLDKRRIFGEIIIPGVGGFLESVGTAGWLQGLIIDGIVGGVGAVLGFVPRCWCCLRSLLFWKPAAIWPGSPSSWTGFFGIRTVGQVVYPMLIGTGCGVPGIMASRTIESERDRRMTVITTTFIPCGAKLPIIALIAGALFKGAWWVAPSAYFVGIAAIVCSGIILKKTQMFAGDPAPFVMELPPTTGRRSAACSAACGSAAGRLSVRQAP